MNAHRGQLGLVAADNELSRELLLVSTNDGLIHAIQDIARTSGWKVKVASLEDISAARGALSFDAILLDHECETTNLDEELGVAVPRAPKGMISLVTVDGSRVRSTTLPRDQLGALREELGRLSLGSVSLPERILGNTASIRAVRESIRQIAPFRDIPVLILGETGTGKELVAQALHGHTAAGGTFLAINCAAIPEGVFESELFGHESGAFTGSRGAHVGLFEAAGTGTVFLDEIGEMPATLQAKLLRVLETRTFRRVGSARNMPLLARVVSATNRRVLTDGAGSLRADLLYRLAGITIALPALRERLDDVPLLVAEFLVQFARRYGRPPTELGPGAGAAFQGHRYPGNIRELKSIVERLAIECQGRAIDAADVQRAIERLPRPHPSAQVPSGARAGTPPLGNRRLRDVERSLIRSAMDEAGGNLSRAARRLGIPRSTLRDKLQRYAPSGIYALDLDGSEVRGDRRVAESGAGGGIRQASADSATRPPSNEDKSREG